MDQTILIVEDEESIIKLLEFNIEKAGYQTDLAYDGREALKKCEENRYDLIVLDLMLPFIDGIEICKTLRRNGDHTPILMLTAKGEEVDKIYGLDNGADDYLTKPFSPKEVLARIRAILRRTARVKDIHLQLKIGEMTIYLERYEAEIGERTIRFTRKEFELLRYMVEHKDKVLTREQLMLAVWNYDFVGDTRIVDVHISHLRDKLESNTRKPKYIKTVRGIGYKIEEPRE